LGTVLELDNVKSSCGIEAKIVFDSLSDIFRSLVFMIESLIRSYNQEAKLKIDLPPALDYKSNEYAKFWALCFPEQRQSFSSCNIRLFKEEGRGLR